MFVLSTNHQSQTEKKKIKIIVDKYAKNYEKYCKNSKIPEKILILK